MSNKAMEQPQQEWWVVFLKWLDFNKITFGTFFLVYKFIDKFFLFLNRFIDGRLKKITSPIILKAVEDEMKPIKEDMADMKKKMDYLIELKLKQ